MRHVSVAVGGQRVRASDEQTDLGFLRHRRRADIGRVDGARGHQPELGAALLDQVEHVLVLGDLAFELERRKTSLERHQGFLVSLRLVRIGHDEREPRFLALREPRGGAVDRRAGFQRALHLRQQRAAGIGQRRRARRAVEQLHAEIDLEVRDRFGDRRLPLAQLARGGRERAEQRGFGEGEQGFGGVAHAADLTALYR